MVTVLSITLFPLSSFILFIFLMGKYCARLQKKGMSSFRIEDRITNFVFLFFLIIPTITYFIIDHIYYFLDLLIFKMFGNIF